MKKKKRILLNKGKPFTINIFVFFAHSDSKFTLMGMPFNQYIEETRAESEVDAKFEQMERKEQKRKLLEHETMYGVGGKPLTPISNLTRTPNKSRRVDNKSRLQTPNSISRKLAAVDKLGGSTSYKRVNVFLDIKTKSSILVCRAINCLLINVFYKQ